MWKDLVFHKQTVRELGETYDLDKKTIRASLESYEVKQKIHFPREVHLVVDALYFGERKEGLSWCVVVFRDPKRKENLWWRFADKETASVYLEGRLRLENLGYKILSVTGDGFSGIRQAFSGILFQMCLVHMKRIVVRGTTRNPKLTQGQVLLSLTKSLFKTDKGTFKRRLEVYFQRYGEFLNEKAVNPLSGEKWFIHEDLRRAALSLAAFLPFLFTYERDRGIPKTSNSIEGHFSHLRDVVNIHRGASNRFKRKIIHTILLASTIAPKEETLKKVHLKTSPFLGIMP